MTEQQRRWSGGVKRARRISGALAAGAAATLAIAAGTAGPALADAATAPTQTVSFTTVGEHPFTVPLGVTSVHVVAIGGRGGGGATTAGLGARVESDVRVSPGSTVYAEVGGNGASAVLAKNQPAVGGANGGQRGGAYTNGSLAQQLQFPPFSGGGGGGASDVQTCPVASCQPIGAGSGALLLVAGGGGGAGAESTGGNGGTPVGANAGPTYDGVSAMEIGLGATDKAGGSNAQYIANYGPVAHCTGDNGESFGGGGGGGGYYCGGGGAALAYAGGGGGGSSYAPAGASYSNVPDAPSVTITYPTAFQLAPASRSSLALDSTDGFGVTQQAPSGAASQLWQLVPQGSLYQVENLASGKCLTSFPRAAQVFLASCATPQAATEWQLPADFGASASGSLIYNPAYNLCLDVSSGSIAAGTPIDDAACNGSASQYFLTFPG